MALRKVFGIETEYGIQQRGAGESNPIAASSVLINAYVTELNRKVWMPQTIFRSGSNTAWACYIDDPSVISVHDDAHITSATSSGVAGTLRTSMPRLRIAFTSAGATRATRA